MWPSLGTRPDILYTVGHLARWNSKPTTAYNVAQKRVLQYLKCTKHYSILYKANFNFKLEGFSDANWGSNIINCKFTSSNCFTLYGGAVVWAAVKQKTVASSLVEAE